MDKKEKVLKILKNKIDKDKPFNEELLKYYYTNNKKFCCDINIDIIFNNIDPFDYIKPIKKLYKYYNKIEPNYYEEIYNKYKKFKFDKPLFIKNYDYDLDEIMLQYVKCFKNMVLMLVWPIANIKTKYHLEQTDFYKHIQKIGKVHGIKELYLSKRQVRAMTYQIYYNKEGFKKLNAIIGKSIKSKASSKINKFFIIHYEVSEKDYKNITGKNASLKNQFRELLLKGSGLPKDTKLNYFLHITDNHTELVELTQLFYNKNSLRLLQYQRLDRCTFICFDYSIFIFMTLKNWLYQEIHPLDHIRFMIFSSIILYSLGVREANDIDLIIDYVSQNIKKKNFDEIIEKHLVDEKTKFPFLDVSVKKPDGWYINGKLSEYTTEWFDKEWPALYKSRSMSETVFNPKFHYYYFGVKLISMDADIKRRIKRSRAAAYADLIALMKYTEQEIKIPPLPEGYWSAHVYYEFTDAEIKKLHKKIKWYLKKRYGLIMDVKDIALIIKK